MAGGGYETALPPCGIAARITGTPTIAVLIITPLMLIAEQCSEDSSGHGFNRAEDQVEDDPFLTAVGTSGGAAGALLNGRC